MSDLSPEVRVPPRTEREATEERVLRNQEAMIEALGKMHDDLIGAAKKLEEMTNKMSGVFWGLMKVPVACVLVCAASWAFLYMNKISETTWLIIMGVSVFPWLGESVTAVANLVRGRNGGGK
jgi:hypothetical protein